MSSTDQNDQPTSEPSTDVELVRKMDWLRAELESVRATASRAVQTRQVGPLDDWVNVLADYDQLAQTICRTEFVPKDFRGQPEKTTAAMMFGREIGLQPMTTLQNTVVIHGRVSMYAEQLRAMILAAGHEYVVDETNSDRCTVSGRRKDSQRWSTFTYTMDQAKLAGLYAQNEQYKKRPTEMLFARSSAMMAHAMFPDVIRGMGAIEEYEGQDDGQPDNAPAQATAKATATVGRKKAQPKALTPAPQIADEVVVPDEPGLPPLPGEEAPPTTVTDAPATVDAGGSAGTTPGEGQATPDEATPAEPPADRHCRDYDNAHDPHTWRTDDSGTWVECTCQGVASVQSASVDPAPVPMSKADTIMVQARFKNLGFTDEPDDREARLRIASTILGRGEEDQVETFRAVHPGEGGMTKPECGRLLRALAPCNGRDDVAELLLTITQARREDTGV